MHVCYFIIIINIDMQLSYFMMKLLLVKQVTMKNYFPTIYQIMILTGTLAMKMTVSGQMLFSLRSHTFFQWTMTRRL